MILIDAVYINNSGGKILLQYLIDSIFFKKINNAFYFLLDDRFSYDTLDQIPTENKLAIKGGEANRISFYKKNGMKFNILFCFANVPPPLKFFNKKVIIYFHNALILDNNDKNLALIQRVSLKLKKVYIKYKSHKNYMWVVQTKHMRDLLINNLAINNEKIKTLPIYDVEKFSGLNFQLSKNDSNYLYVADGVKQKNHDLLLKAWEIIFDSHELELTLHLTVPSRYKILCNEITRLVNKGVLIVNHGHCTFEELKSLYTNCNYFLMPSLSESFGLPLIEAASAGCEIIAVELEYVHDVVEPMMSFCDTADAMDLVSCILSAHNHKKCTRLIVKDEMDSLLNLLTTNA